MNAIAALTGILFLSVAANIVGVWIWRTQVSIMEEQDTTIHYLRGQLSTLIYHIKTPHDD
jgi:hypothetical protein